MKTRLVSSAFTLVVITACAPSRHESYPPPPTASELASRLPPLKMPVPVFPVGLRTAVLTLPADALAEMSLDGRRNYLVYQCGEFDQANRRVHFYKDNPHLGIDAKSMIYLRLFEDEQGRTIAASHSARPFADGSEPSPRFTRVYRLEDHKWRDISDSAFAPGIPRDAFFRFDQRGSKVGYGRYVEKDRADGRGKCHTFGKIEGTLRWRDGAFREETKS